MSWLSFFEKPHALYVSEKHKDEHYRRICLDLIPYVLEHRARVLDYACGEATWAHILSRHCDGLLLYDGADAVRKELARNYDRNTDIVLLDDVAVQALPAASLAMISAVSFLQYLSKDEAARLMKTWQDWLKPSGLLVLGDILPPQSSAVRDALSLLKFAFENGFFFAALFGLVRTVFSPYVRLRRSLGLTRYNEAELTHALQALGFFTRRAPKNIGHNKQRFTILAYKPKEGETDKDFGMKIYPMMGQLGGILAVKELNPKP